MQKKVVDWLYNLQSRWGILKEEERSLYEYAYRLLLSRILIYSIIIALGIITGNWLEMFSFLLPFVILRQYVGGIHLKRSVSCICVSGFLIFICGKYLAINSELGITFCIVWLIAIAVIFLLCPVDTGHKRLDEKERKVYGKSARKIIMILASMHSGLTTPSLITVYTISTITDTLQVLLSPALIFIRSCTAAFSMTT